MSNIVFKYIPYEEETFELMTTSVGKCIMFLSVKDRLGPDRGRFRMGCHGNNASPPSEP